ncbi:MAG: 5'-methylthioadenosine/adenosylhomocysteine nucleosidase [Lachnospiraceae bacterium]|nr:5'-methylthioadenosine/adenosylhomocysteine nucleosidase [Lachnospiraceae bacterium]
MKPTLGIIGAEQQEIDLLLNLLTLERTVVKAASRFFCGTIHDYPVVIVKAGIGKVNAAACTQMLADLFDVKYLINTGAAGSLNADINIGDIVLSTDVIQHDVDVQDLGYEPGMIPDTGKIFTADETLRELAASCCREANPDVTVFQGRILTGDQFISSSASKDRLIDTFHGMCAEMEGGAIAQIASLNRIPFLIVRSISDKADGSATMDYPQFSQMASVHSARLVEELIKHL